MTNPMNGIGNWRLDWVLELGIVNGIGDWDWGFGIGDWDWGLELGIGIWISIEDWG